MTHIEQFKSARIVSTPLVYFVSADATALMKAIRESFTTPVPFVQWDMIRGFVPQTPAGHAALVAATKALIAERKQQNPQEDDFVPPAWASYNSAPDACAFMHYFPESTCTFLLGFHRFLLADSMLAAATWQAFWNLRDVYKANRRTAVPIGPLVKLPVEAASDVIMLEEPLPDDAALSTIVQSQHDAAKLTAATEEVCARAVDAVRGLSAYAAEQVTAMSLTPKGLDLVALRERKRINIEQTPGLSVDRWASTFDQMQGNEQIKRLGRGVMEGEDSPRLIVRLEELDKTMAGAGADGGPGDNTGIAQDRLQMILNTMEDEEYTGIVAFGPAGSGKSMFSKILGATYQRFSITMDLGAMTNGVAGESEQRVRQALRIVKALAGHGGAFFIATANALRTIPAPLRRRFTLGNWYFDLPSKSELAALWVAYLTHYGLDVTQPRPLDTGWTGAEVRNACSLARRLRIPILQAAQFIVPVSLADAEGLRALREQANGRFLSTSYPGVYQKDLAVATAVAGAIMLADQGASPRAIAFDDLPPEERNKRRGKG